jgi:hypothetical protein
MNSALGTLLSVAKVCTVAVELPATFAVTVCWVPPVGVELNCLYVGVPKALLVFADWFK